MKTLVALAAVLVPALACAQPMGSLPEPSTGEFNMHATTVGYSYSAIRDTPTMERYKLKRALDLKAEAAALLEADGGTFTREHEGYIRRKARDILGY